MRGLVKSQIATRRTGVRQMKKYHQTCIVRGEKKGLTKNQALLYSQLVIISKMCDKERFTFMRDGVPFIHCNVFDDFFELYDLHYLNTSNRLVTKINGEKIEFITTINESCYETVVRLNQRTN